MTSKLIGWKPVANNRNIASARLRCYDPLEALQKAGAPVEVFSRGNLNRYATVIIQKGSAEEDVELAETTASKGIRLIYDLCDNLFQLEADSTQNIPERIERVRRISQL